MVECSVKSFIHTYFFCIYLQVCCGRISSHSSQIAVISYLKHIHATTLNKNIFATKKQQHWNCKVLASGLRVQEECCAEYFLVKQWQERFSWLAANIVKWSYIGEWLTLSIASLNYIFWWLWIMISINLIHLEHSIARNPLVTQAVENQWDVHLKDVDWQSTHIEWQSPTYPIMHQCLKFLSARPPETGNFVPGRRTLLSSLPGCRTRYWARCLCYVIGLADDKM